MAERDPAAFEIVRGELNRDAVTLNDFDKKLAHLAGNMGEDGVAILKLNPEEGVG
jgi:hypothetical protein